jgi:prepilin-type N-terminal cleavage/methylation domain-containing protein
MNSNQGFTLIEVMIALIIMAIVGLLSWRGLDGTLRSKESIEGHMLEHKTIQLLINYWQNDCKNIPSKTDSDLPSFIKGNKNFWLIKRLSTTSSQGWQIIGYSLDNNQLHRVQSLIYPTKMDFDLMWSEIVKDPDLNTRSLLVTLELPGISSQLIQPKYQNQINQGNLKSVLLGLEAGWQFSSYTNRLTISCLIEN